MSLPRLQLPRCLPALDAVALFNFLPSWPTLDKLVAQRDALDREIRQHELALSPVHHLPAELLSLIFTFALKHHVRESLPSWCLRPDTAPWTFSAVCKRWRAVALAPVFWTTINTSTPLFSHFRFRLRVERSGCLPLRITFFTRGDYMNEVERQMLNLLVQHCERWEDVNLVGSEQLYAYLQLTRPRFSILRKLHLQLYGAQADSSVLQLFSRAPKLQEVSLNMRRDVPSRPIVWDLPWDQLLSYRTANGWNGLAALASAVNLVDCTLDVAVGEQPADAQVVLLPSLLRLSISHRELLTCLKTPILTDLYYHRYDDQNLSSLVLPPNLPHTLKNFVLVANAGRNTSLASLRNLDLAAIVHTPPGLRSFAFTQPLPTDVVITFLRTTGRMLDRVSIGFEDVDVKSDRRLFDALEAMDWESAQWPTIRFLYYPGLRQEIRERLQVLRSRGADVEFIDSSRTLYQILVPESMRIQRN